jgi:hypothetical protein
MSLLFISESHGIESMPVVPAAQRKNDHHPRLTPGRKHEIISEK